MRGVAKSRVAAPAGRYTVADLEAGRVPNPGAGGYELDAGKLVCVSPNAWRHELVRWRLWGLLGPLVKERLLGALLPELGLALGPADLRAPDLALVPPERIPAQTDVFAREMPVWVAEIVSPGNRRREVERKVQQYLAAGIGVIWVIDPTTETVRVIHAGGAEQLVRGGEVLAEPEIFPDLEFPASALFRD